MQDESGLIEETRCLSENYYLIRIKAPRIAKQAKPGNFVMVRVASSLDPLLRRPFGILQSQPPHIWLYFQVKGRGTSLLKARQAGDRLDILGPLGNAFPELPDKKTLPSPAAGALFPCSIMPKIMPPANHCCYCMAAAAPTIYSCWLK